MLSQEAKLLARLAELDATAPPAQTRGARTFLVDRALEYAAIARGASSPAARRAALRRRGITRARSKGYISIMVRLGEAFRDRPDSELARYRSRRITWKLAQRVVRSDRSAEQIREALLIEATLWSPGGTRRPRRPEGKLPAQLQCSEIAPAPSIYARGDSPSNRRGYGWELDVSWATRDPAGYLESYERHLGTLHRAVSAEISRALKIRAGEADAGQLRVAAQQSLRQLTASLTRTADQHRGARTFKPLTAEATMLLARLDVLRRVLDTSVTPTEEPQ